MYGRRARWARTQLPRELELTPNYAQASLRKTARPVRRSWAGDKIGVLPAELYGIGRTGLACSRPTAARISQSFGLIAPLHQRTVQMRVPRVSSLIVYTTVCKEPSRQAPRCCDVCSLCNVAGSRRRSVQTRPSDFSRPTDATPNMDCFPSPRATLSCPGFSIVGRTRSHPSILQGQLSFEEVTRGHD
jgi:hypothetical protein